MSEIGQIYENEMEGNMSDDLVNALFIGFFSIFGITLVAIVVSIVDTLSGKRSFKDKQDR